MTTSAFDSLIARIERGEHVDQQQLIHAKRTDDFNAKRDAEQREIAEAVAKAQAEAQAKAKATEAATRAKVEQYSAEVAPVLKEIADLKDTANKAVASLKESEAKANRMYAALCQEIRETYPDPGSPVYVNVVGQVMVDGKTALTRPDGR